MRTGNILFLSTWLSVSTAHAALTPARRSPLEADTGHQFGQRVPEGLQILEDEIVTVKEYDYSKCQPTTFITATVPATTAGIYLNTSYSSVTPVSQYSVESYLNGGISSEAPSGVTKVLIPATAATYSNSPPTDLPSNCPNGPNSRNCWNNCTVDTNYEQTWPVTNTTVEYWLTIQNVTLSPDGFTRQVLAFNGTIPGPLITANWGDTIKVHITNELQNNGTGIHWHGFRQLNTNDQDGTSGITECPLAPGQTKTYEFVATTYGTSWYHTHFSTQYGDGAVGPIVINGPASADYDVDLGPILIQDWYHQTIFQNEWRAQHIGAPIADNYLLNGINAPVNSTDGNRLTLNFTKGKKYLLRFINAGTDAFYKVGIDGHNFTVIANDFVPITPFETDFIPLGIGQRYDVIVEATADIGNYWLRAITQTSCAACSNTGLDIANGIISYDGAPSGLPTSVAGDFTDNCRDIPSASLIPVVAKAVDKAGFTADNILAVGAPTLANTTYGTNVFTWSLDGVAINVDWNNPTLLQLQNGVTDFTPAENVFKLDTPNIWTYWVVQNKFQVPHPMHLHGHDFSLLGQGTGIFDATNATLNFDNPTRRDTAMLIENGWTVFAFETDNPGAWLFHCHIGWHVGGGLSMQFLEREKDILSTVSIDAKFTDTCGGFAAYGTSEGNVYGKTDSGL